MVRLTKQQKQFYDENGYILLKNVFTDQEFKELEEAYDRLYKSKNEQEQEGSWVGTDKDNRKSDSPYTVLAMYNLHHHHATFSKILLNDSLIDAVEDCLGSENVALHHTKAHYKPPEKGAEYPMHQDCMYFPFVDYKTGKPAENCLAAFIHLDAAFPENGGLFVNPGSHKLGPQEDHGAKEGSFFHYCDKKKWPLSKGTPVIAERGDVVLFSYHLVHGSPMNSSTKPRRMYLVQYFDPNYKYIGTQRKNPSYGWMIRGANHYKDASTAAQYDFE